LSSRWRRRLWWRIRLGGVLVGTLRRWKRGGRKDGAGVDSRGLTGQMFLPDGLEVDFDAEALSDAVETA
jgi:hypothetical protein